MTKEAQVFVRFGVPWVTTPPTKQEPPAPNRNHDQEPNHNKTWAGLLESNLKKEPATCSTHSTSSSSSSPR